MPLKIAIPRQLPPARLTVRLPGEIAAKLEHYRRLLGEHVTHHDVIAEALRLCFDSDREFQRSWEGSSHGRGAAAPRAAAEITKG